MTKLISSELRDDITPCFLSEYPAEDDIVGWCRLREKDDITGLFGKAADEIESLRQQLAECERERDELKQWLEDQVCEAKDFAYKLESKTIELAAVTKERDKLVSALEGIASGEDSDGCITSIKYCIRTAQKALAKLGADKTGEKA